jgi:hypothetical protein
MKTKKFFIVITALIIAANVFAIETPKVNITPLKDTKALVTIEHLTPSVNEVTITDGLGKVVYYKKSKNELNGYKKIFDLSQLEEGNYEMSLKSGSVTYKNDLKIENGTITVKKQRKEVEPYVNYQDNKMQVSFLNYENKNAVVKIYKESKLVFSSKLGEEFAIHRVFDLSALKKGDYDVLLASSDREYWFSVSK